MTLPNKFKFTSHDCDTFIYTATLARKLVYVVSWTEDFKRHVTHYSLAEIENYLQNGSWKIIVEPVNAKDSIKDVSDDLCILISEKEDASELSSKEVQALYLTRRLITRLLDDRQ